MFVVPYNVRSIKNSEVVMAYSSTADILTVKYGETISKAQAARVLGISRPTVYSRIERGLLRVTADGRVNTRSMAAYCAGAQHKERAVKRPQATPRFHVE